ncbi:RPM1-interacting protein 4-like [Magnolia sinica]|uniref:RPM1-interacting protein 4-like n=1 Tax=Magnolia sinica TaxID=86752 RepID=UPI00265879C4|nr:RPM1-interacting protein 4-like [Magnolia sinica]
MAHVPKFGDWDSENIPYTTYFENARKDKGTGTKMINPNDPEQNPEAFMYVVGASEHESKTRQKHRVESSKTLGTKMINPNDPEQNPEAFMFVVGASEHESKTRQKHRVESSKTLGTKMINPNHPEQNPDAFMFQTRVSNHESETRQTKHVENLHAPESHHAIHAPPFQVTSDKGMHVMKQEHEKHSSREEEDVFHADHRASLDPQRNRNHKNGKSRSGSDKSSSDYSLLKSHRHTERSSQSRTSGEGSNSYTPSLNTRVNEIPQRIASVPKFGSWDETDPRSGDGFTVIFNKVKEEKQNAKSRFSTVAETTLHPNSGHKNNGRSPSRSKKCCGLF